MASQRARERGAEFPGSLRRPEHQRCDLPPHGGWLGMSSSAVSTAACATRHGKGSAPTRTAIWSACPRDMSLAADTVTAYEQRSALGRDRRQQIPRSRTVNREPDNQAPRRRTNSTHRSPQGVGRQIGEDRKAGAVNQGRVILPSGPPPTANGWRADCYSRTPPARPDVPQLEDIEFIPCAGRLADRRVRFAASP
jgi:hypothetical protein